MDLEQKYESILEELKNHWSAWDRAVDSGDEAGLRQARDKMVDLLNRRNYIRNLVRDVNEVLGS